MFLTHFRAIADRYDGYIFDVWGVVHDGTQLYPGVLECLSELKAIDKKIIFLSNAPRRIDRVITVLHALGIKPALYDGVMTSGEAAYMALARGEAVKGKRYYYIGPDKDAGVLNGLNYVRVPSIDEAEFALNVGFGSEEQLMADVKPALNACAARGLPMLCLNPDMEVVKITGERYACAGVLAQEYERIGGKVTWFGKPYPEVYAQCLKLLAPLEKSTLLAIGDGPHTDILGANNAAIAAMYVAGGIGRAEHPEMSEAAIAEYLNGRGVSAHYAMAELVW